MSDLDEIINNRDSIYTNLKNTIYQVYYRPDRIAAIEMIKQIHEVEYDLVQRFDQQSNYSTAQTGKVRTTPEMLQIIKNAEGPGTTKDINGNLKTTSTIEVFPDPLFKVNGLHLVGYGHAVVGRTADGWDIGYGIKIQGNIITEEMREDLFTRDILKAEHALQSALKPATFANLNDNRFSALVDMVYNMGIGDGKTGFLSFKKMIAALDISDWATAAREMQSTRDKLGGLVTRRGNDARIFMTP